MNTTLPNTEPLTQSRNGTLLGFRPQLDGLRFLAVFIVVVYHYFPFLQHIRSSFDLGIFIVFFFVLSSYLITKILIKAKEKAEEGVPRIKIIFAFLIRRTLRIFPAYYFYLLLVFLLPAATLYLKDHAAAFFLYVSNFTIYREQNWGELTPHLWTLAVEEQFYLVWPWIILFVPTHLLKHCFLFIITAGTIFRFVFLLLNPTADSQPVTFVILTPSCIDAFAFGALLAFLHMEGKLHNTWLKKCFFFSLPVWIVLTLIHIPEISIATDRLFAGIFSMYVIEGAFHGYRNKAGKFLENKLVLFLAKISYGIYLYHLVVPYLFWKAYNKMAFLFYRRFSLDLTTVSIFLAKPWVICWVYLGFTILFAIASWYLLELPFSNLKRFVGYSFGQKKQHAVRG